MLEPRDGKVPCGAIKAQNLTNSADAKVLIHDAVRPLVSKDILINCINKLDLYDAIDVAIPATDTIIEIDADDKIINQIPTEKNCIMAKLLKDLSLCSCDIFWKLQ